MTQPGMGHGDMIHDDMAGKDPQLAELLSDAYDVCVGIDVSAQHLWTLNQEAEFFKVSRELYEDDDFIDDIDFAMAADDMANEGLSFASTSDADTDSKLQAIFNRAQLSDNTTVEADLEEAGSVVANHTSERVVDSWFHKHFLSRSLVSAMPTISIALMLVVSTSGFSMASQYSAPGDFLYGLKRGTEQARLAFTFSNESRSQLQVELANTRLQELRQVGTVKPEVVPELIEDLNTAIQDAAQVPSTASASMQIANEAQQEVNKLDLVAQEREQHANNPVKIPVKQVVKVEVPAALVRQATKPEVVASPSAAAKPKPTPAATALAVPTVPAVPTGKPQTASTTQTTNAIASAAASAAAAIAKSDAGQVLAANGVTTITVRHGDVTAVVNAKPNGATVAPPTPEEAAVAATVAKELETTPPAATIEPTEPGEPTTAVVLIQDPTTAAIKGATQPQPEPTEVVVSTPQSTDGTNIVTDVKDLSAPDTTGEDISAETPEATPLPEIAPPTAPITDTSLNGVLAPSPAATATTDLIDTPIEIEPGE